MKKSRLVNIYKKSYFSDVKDMINVFDKSDTFDNLSKCTRISHILSGNIIQEPIDQHVILSVSRTDNFFINLN